MLKADQLINLYRAGVMHRDEISYLLPAALATQPDSIHLAVNDRLVTPEQARTMLGLPTAYRPGMPIQPPTFPTPSTK